MARAYFWIERVWIPFGQMTFAAAQKQNAMIDKYKVKSMKESG